MDKILDTERKDGPGIADPVACSAGNARTVPLTFPMSNTGCCHPQGMVSHWLADRPE